MIYVVHLGQLDNDITRNQHGNEADGTQDQITASAHNNLNYKASLWFLIKQRLYPIYIDMFSTIVENTITQDDYNSLLVYLDLAKLIDALH